MCIYRGAAFAALSLLAGGALAQVSKTQGIWQPSTSSIFEVDQRNLQNRWFANYKLFRLDPAGLKARLAEAPLEKAGAAYQPSIPVQLPMPNGTVETFRVYKAPVFTPEVGAQMPGVMTYAGTSESDRSTYVRFDVGPNGFHGLVLSPDGTVVIDPVGVGSAREYLVFYRHDASGPRTWNCYTDTFTPSSAGKGILSPNTQNLRTFRLAMHGTGEYTAVFGTQAAAMAQVVTTTNRIAAVYEADLSIKLQLVHNHVFSDASTDPFTGTNVGTMLQENQALCDSELGDANYDIGHAMSTGFGGIAGLGVVGRTGQKARGCTGLDNPTGDQFDIDFVAHEMGHQFGGNHTFDGTTGSCGFGSRHEPTAFEPGSGSTIMAYAGICGSQDVQAHSDPYFHVHSLLEIGILRDQAESGGSTTATSNRRPDINPVPIPSPFIPRQTPFKLSAVGTDADGDVIRYTFEQYTQGTVNNPLTQPLFRSQPPSPQKFRVFPKMATINLGQTDPWEKLPTVDRNLVFSVVGRDMHAGGGAVDIETMGLTVQGDPFFVTSPSTYETWAGGETKTITWNPGGTTSYSPNVNILISYNGGASYPFGLATVLLANTPNDGSADVTLPPNLSGDFSKIIVESASSVFFNVSKNVKVVPAPDPLLISLSASSVVGGTTVTGTVTINPAAPAGGTVVNLSDNGTELSVPASVTVAASATTATFPVTTSPVQANVTRTVTATQGANTKTANLTLTPGGLATFTLNPTTVNGGDSTTGTVTLTGPAGAGGTVVTLSDNSSVINTPANVSVAQGATSANAIIGTTPVSGTATRQVYAQLGSVKKTANLTVVPAPNLSTFTISPNPVVGGNPVNGTVTLTAAAGSNGVTISLSDNTSVINPPSSVTVDPGATSKTFSIATSPVSQTVTRQVYANAGSVSRTVNLTLQPGGPALQSLVISPNSVKGGTATTGTVTLTAAAGGSGIVVSITDNSGSITTPSSVTVTSGATTGSFQITTSPVTATATRQVTAIYNGVSRISNLTLTP